MTQPNGIRTASGQTVLLTAPTRYHAYRADGGRYSLSAAADFLSDAGFDGADLSLELITGLDGWDGDEGWRSVLYGFGNRAAARGLSLPLCHLPFYMPSPDNAPAMTRFARELANGIRAAALLAIPLAVIHPIVRHSSRRCREEWLAENMAFLSPLCELAGRMNVTLCLENMAGRPYDGYPTEVIFGSRAVDMRDLATRLGAAVCWDFGHAHLTGLCQSVELECLAGLVRAVHIHDNDGVTDTHRIPGDAPHGIDWDDAAEGLRLCGYLDTPLRCLDLELKSSHLPDDRSVRLSHAARAMAAVRCLGE